ncbi:MAG: hypothetical protein LBP20_01055 [Treponema sp.]|jgi:hypothetical protein|nr:hypothetical protein [Treponema sp.]
MDALRFLGLVRRAREASGRKAAVPADEYGKLNVAVKTTLPTGGVGMKGKSPYKNH